MAADSKKTQKKSASKKTTAKKKPVRVALSKKGKKDDRPIIKIEKLVKKYGDLTAVNNISFEVKKGEVFGILGPNGAGKTTTLEIIETLIPKTSGKVKIDGLDIDIYPEEIKKLIGVQLQESGFFPDLKLIEILKLFADIYNVSPDYDALFKKFGLEEKRKEKYEHLSGGQKRRFSMMATLIADPLIVFLDEPTTGLDPQARRNIWDTVLELKKKGKTIVITTHYMDEAEHLCDRIAVMDDGKILEINTARKFIKDLVGKGFKKPQPKYGATLEDVFLSMTGKKLRD